MRCRSRSGRRRRPGWLDDLVGSSRDFDGDAGNRLKSEKNDVVATQVEQILRHPVLFAGRIVEPAHEEPRWLLLGIDGSGRPLALIFTRQGRRLRPISCRPMRRSERRLYGDEVGF